MTWINLNAALWLGILTSISPCPLASNIAAISFISRRMARPSQVLFSGGLYAVGRSAAYAILGVVILAGVLVDSEVSRFLQKYMNEILGPLLILVGMILVGLLGQSLSLNLTGASAEGVGRKEGLWWAGALGFLFALSFCPVSAGLFFGGLLPLAMASQSHFLLPVFYGLGTALPVIVFAFIITFTSQYLGKAFHVLSKVEWWVRNGTGAIFIATGVYYCLLHIYGVWQ